MNGGTKIRACDCAHQYQDAKYGKGQRVMVYCGDKVKSLRCTVCRREYKVA